MAQINVKTENFKHIRFHSRILFIYFWGFLKPVNLIKYSKKRSSTFKINWKI